MAVYEAGFTVQEKEDRSPLTEADRRAHTAIAQHLAATDLPLLSEEGRTIAADERQAWHRYWLVDPLDGTKEFIKRNGEFTVNIALVQDTVAVLGALYVPVKDVLYFAWPGGGAWRQEHAATHGAMSAYERAARSVRLEDRGSGLDGRGRSVVESHRYDRPFDLYGKRAPMDDPRPAPANLALQRAIGGIGFYRSNHTASA